MDILISLGIFLFAIVFILVVKGFFIVQQQSAALIERFGKCVRIASPGLHFRIPFVDIIRARVKMRIMQLDVQVETKTHDNVFLDMMVSVQYQVLEGKIFEAFYMLTKPEEQIQAFVFDLVRAEIPKLILDDVFSKKDEIAHAVKRELQDQMTEFGYKIIKALITDIQPDANVKHAMNEINTAQRLRMASLERGEAEKIMRVKQAEAEAEANILHGRGIAGQRREIMEGLSSSVEEMTQQLPALSAPQVMDMVLLVQYFDMMREVGSGSRANVVFVPHSPSNLGDLHEQIRETIFSASLLDATKGSARKAGKTLKKAPARKRG